MGDRPLMLADGQPVPDGPGVYLLHFVNPATGQTARYRHAGHYLGVATKDLPTRLRQELAGRSEAANLVRIVYAAGLTALVDQVWEGKGREYERRLKNRGGAAQYCNRCRQESPATRGRAPQHAFRPRTLPNSTDPAGLSAAPGMPAPVAAFLKLNPSFQRPARSPQAVQYARAVGREESAALTDRVRFALEDDNQPLSQNRAAAVIGRGRDAHAQALRQRAAQHREVWAEQTRPARLVQRARQQLNPSSRAAQARHAGGQAGRASREVSERER